MCMSFNCKNEQWTISRMPDSEALKHKWWNEIKYFQIYTSQYVCCFSPFPCHGLIGTVNKYVSAWLTTKPRRCSHGVEIVQRNQYFPLRMWYPYINELKNTQLKASREKILMIRALHPRNVTINLAMKKYPCSMEFDISHYIIAQHNETCFDYWAHLETAVCFNYLIYCKL